MSGRIEFPPYHVNVNNGRLFRELRTSDERLNLVYRTLSSNFYEAQRRLRQSRDRDLPQSTKESLTALHDAKLVCRIAILDHKRLSFAIERLSFWLIETPLETK